MEPKQPMGSFLRSAVVQAHIASITPVEEDEFPETGCCGRCGEDNGNGGTVLWCDLCEDCDEWEGGGWKREQEEEEEEEEEEASPRRMVKARVPVEKCSRCEEVIVVHGAYPDECAKCSEEIDADCPRCGGDHPVKDCLWAALERQ
jgi:hypothetical protein